MDGAPRAQLAGLDVADEPDVWRGLGFAVDDADRVILGGVAIQLGSGAGMGITGWTLRGVPDPGDIDGLRTTVTSDDGAPPLPTPDHPNGAIALDHVVVMTPDFDRTASILDARGLKLRRVREAGPRRQGFRRLGPTILELVDAPEAGVTAFWGLVVILRDLSRLPAQLAPHVGAVKPAVQPGRHIATVRSSAGVSMQMAFMDPEPPVGQT